MALLTDLISPATLTGFTRAAFENYESNADSLNVYLPNQTTPQNSVSITLEDNGLVDVAEYRAYDSELDMANMGDVDEVVVRMLPLGVKIPISEFDQVSAIGSAALSDQSTPAVTVMSAERLKSSSSAGRPDLWKATLPVEITRPRSSSARSAVARAARTAARRTASSR